MLKFIQYIKKNSPIYNFIYCYLFILSFLLLSFSQFNIFASDFSISSVVSNLHSSVVSISTIQIFKEFSSGPGIPDELFKFFNNPNGFHRYSKAVSLGSGFFIDNKGHVVTNNHVIENAHEINIVIGGDKKIYKAFLLGSDKKTDLALIKVNVSKSVSFVKFGDSDIIEVGDKVIAIGNAFGFGGTVTSGIVSAKNRYLGGNFYEDFIQTDASINKGNSGGPMFNIRGEVIGMNSAIISPNGGNVGVGFAIPSNVVRYISSKLLIEGKINRPWLGITFQNITPDMSKILKLKDCNGVIISDVIHNGPAFNSGILIGDVILKFNDIILDSSINFPQIILNSTTHSSIPLEIFRKGNIIKYNINLDFFDSQYISSTHEEIFIDETFCSGIYFIDIDSYVSNKYNINDNISGIFITNVDPDSDAYNKGMRLGDIVICANQDYIYSSTQFLSILDNIKLDNNNNENISVVLLISRNDNNFYITVDLY